MERITAIEGDIPVLLIAPHGPSDDNTAILTKMLAKKLKAFAVINNGFERSSVVDYDNDKADCNNVAHCQTDGVREEFLNPIKAYCNRIQQDYYETNIFIIHGMADPVLSKADAPLDMVLGFGDAPKPSFSCSAWKKDAFLYIMQSNSINTYAGRAGGKYAGAGRSNLNQFYRKHEFNDNVHSMQIEIINSLRVTSDMCELTSDDLKKSIVEYVEFLEDSDGTDNPSGLLSWHKNWRSIGQNIPTW